MHYVQRPIKLSQQFLKKIIQHIVENQLYETNWFSTIIGKRIRRSFVMRSFSEIRHKVERGDAVVLTSQEIREMLDKGDKLTLKDVDVITTATRGVMSGTYAVFSFPVARQNVFARAKKAWLNGVPAKVGPCPNERLGILDVMVFGTAHSKDCSTYGGGHLFRDLVERKKVNVEIQTDQGRTLNSEISLDDMPTARLFGTRHCFKNYSAFVNPSAETVSTIFHAIKFPSHWKGASVSGCGHLNPVENDPLLDTIGVGSKVLINGAEGFVLGAGTRSSPEKPNLSGFADLHKMEPEYMGGFLTSAGPECVCSWAVAIPVINESILKNMTKRDGDVPLPVMDVVERSQIGSANYGDVWEETDLEVKFDLNVCKKCDQCIPQFICPSRAISFEDGLPQLDRIKCFNCGLCATACAGQTFSANLGSLRFNDRTVPIVVRQSDRKRALKLADDLKRRILEGRFKVTEMAERIYP